MDAIRWKFVALTVLSTALTGPGAAAAESQPGPVSRDDTMLARPWVTRLAQVPPAARPTTPPTPAPAPPLTPTPAPPAVAAATPAPAPTPPPAQAPGLDASLGLLEQGESPIMLGDISPNGTIRAFALPGLGPPPNPVPPVPPRPGLPPAFVTRPGLLVRSVISSTNGFKIADNQSPRPQDRVYATFNYFGDVNGSINRRLGGVFSEMHIYRETFGFEKTFWDRNASFGMRVPLDTLSVKTPLQAYGGTHTSMGNLSIFGKYVLWQDAARKNLVSAGLMVNAPTGPSSFAGAPASKGFRDLSVQPFLGFFVSEGNWYAQGFSAVNVATDPNDVTSFFNDLGVGYFLYRAASKTALLQAFAPTFEAHINTPLNHRGFRLYDPAGTPDVVNLTYGVSLTFRQGAILSMGVATPVTGPRPFDYEVMAVLNWYFGPTKRAGFPSAVSPPLF